MLTNYSYWPCEKWRREVDSYFKLQPSWTADRETWLTCKHVALRTSAVIPVPPSAGRMYPGVATAATDDVTSCLTAGACCTVAVEKSWDSTGLFWSARFCRAMKLCITQQLNSVLALNAMFCTGSTAIKQYRNTKQLTRIRKFWLVLILLHTQTQYYTALITA